MKKKFKIGIIGLGYVGLPVCLSFAKKYETIGYDIDKDKINWLTSKYKGNKKNLKFEIDITRLKTCNIYIITVPTPINTDNSPDLTALVLATESVGKILSKNDIVIYESTVYPGCTEEVCVPLLEKHSEMVFNQDFFCGYSPERINPGDKKRTIEKIVKVMI